jgi:hypothetical protein
VALAAEEKVAGVVGSVTSTLKACIVAVVAAEVDEVPDSPEWNSGDHAVDLESCYGKGATAGVEGLFPVVARGFEVGFHTHTETYIRTREGLRWKHSQ